MMQTYMGLRVILNESLTVPGEPYQVARTWKERLFTRPWRPLKATRTVVPQVPSKEVYVTNEFIAMHPAIWEKVEAAIKKQEEQELMNRRDFRMLWSEPLRYENPMKNFNWRDV